MRLKTKYIELTKNKYISFKNKFKFEQIKI